MLWAAGAALLLAGCFPVSSSPGTPPASPADASRGTGPAFRLPWGLRVLDAGHFLVTDSEAGSVFRVDLDTGDRTVVCSATREVPLAPGGVVVGPGGRMYVGDINLDSVNLYDRKGRFLRVVSRAGTRGRGPAFEGDLRLESLPDGSLAVLDETGRRVFRVDPTSGDREPLTGGGRGAGPSLVEPVDLQWWEGSLVVLDSLSARLCRVALDTGDRTLLADLRDSRGPAMASPEGLGLAANGDLLISDNMNGLVVAMDPRTHARRVVNRPGDGAGPLLSAVKDPAGLPDGSVLASVPYWRCVLRVRPDGTRSLVSGAAPPSTPIRVVPDALAVVDEDLLLGDDLAGGVLAMDMSSPDHPMRRLVPPSEAPLPLALVPAPGRLYVLDFSRGLLEWNSGTRQMKVLVPRGNGFMETAGLMGLAAAPDGGLYVLDGGSGVLLRLDPGARRLRTVSGPGRGLGPTLLDAHRLVCEGPDHVLVTGGRAHVLLRLDVASGDRTVASGPGHGSGPTLSWPAALLRTPSGHLLMSDEALDAILEVDPVTGDRQVVSGPERGDGPPLYGPMDLAVGPDGTIYLADPGVSDLTTVDPRSGDRERLTLTPPLTR